MFGYLNSVIKDGTINNILKLFIIWKGLYDNSLLLLIRGLIKVYILNVIIIISPITHKSCL